MILRVAKRIFAPLAIACLVYFAWDARASLADVVASAEPWPLLAAVIVWTLMHVLAPVFATLIFRARGHGIRYTTAADIHIANIPARYVPGGVWHTVGRAAAFRGLGMEKRDIAVFVFLENALAIGVAFVIGGSSVAWFRGFEGWGQIAAFAAGGGAVLLFATPYILATRVLQGKAPFEVRDYLACIALVAMSWCVAAGAFTIFVGAFPELELRASPLETGGAYLFSWGVGFVSVFAPQGIGVFEVVAADLVRGPASIKSIAALLAGFRLVILAADAFTWAALQVISRGNRRLQGSRE